MLPFRHFLYGILFSLICFLIFPEIGLVGFLLILSSTVLIDVDHYLFYVYKKKDWNLKKSYEWFIQHTEKLNSFSRKQREKYYVGFVFLHGVEILIILYLFSLFISKYFIYIFTGFAFHLLLDLVEQTIYWNRFDRISLIYDFIKYKKLKFIEDDN